MDFIERWFGVSPDGGNGSLEALYFVAVAVVVSAVVFRACIGWMVQRRPRGCSIRRS
jgi:hypothetical protein